MLHFTVSFPTDEGYLGRECNAPGCKRYFRVHQDDIQDRMFCPYCGGEFNKDKLFTKDQLDHARRVVEEKFYKHAHDEFSRMLHDTFGRHSGSGMLRWEVKTTPYRERRIRPKYQELKVDSALTCNHCSTRFQVDGIFGYCPKCRSEHIRVYEANLGIIRQEVERHGNQDRALRHAYCDLVSTFELVCKRRAKKITPEDGRFQNLTATKEFFKKHTATDVFASLSASEELTLRRVFQKRHLFTHGENFIDDKYIKLVPEDTHLKGTTPVLSMIEFEAGAEALRRVVDRIVDVSR
jgi:uncharacterized Zn-finger protein